MMDQTVWETGFGSAPNSEVFRRETLSQLQEVSLGTMAKLYFSFLIEIAGAQLPSI
jgi:hypothetical protein